MAEKVYASFAAVRLVLQDDWEDKGVGSFDVREEEVVWRQAGTEDSVVRFHFKEISLSAIADCPVAACGDGSSSEGCSRQCLYLQIDGEGTGSESEEEDFRCVYLIPVEGEDVLDAMFQSMCEGALRNPDSDADDEQGGFFFDMASAVTGSFDESVSIQDDLDALVKDDPGRFERD
jgi:hypothetical protein